MIFRRKPSRSEAAFNDLVIEIREHIAEKQAIIEQLRHAQAQRDRAISRVNALLRAVHPDTRYWHPDMDEPPGS